MKFRSIITDIFDGKILSAVQCLTCSRISETKETFQDLSLPIPSKEQLDQMRQTESAKMDSEANNGWVSWLFGWMKGYFIFILQFAFRHRE